MRIAEIAETAEIEVIAANVETGAAIEVTRAPAAFVAAMERLGALNLAERRPARLKELFCGTHPSLEERIARGQAAARQLAEAT